MEIKYYSAPWCAPCKQMWPRIQRFAEKHGIHVDKIDISETNVDGILSVPTIDIIRNGKLEVRYTDARMAIRHIEGEL